MIRTQSGQCWLTFNNGITISIFNGFGSYSENHYKYELARITDQPIESKDCEVAIIRNEKFITEEFIPEASDGVKGYVTANELEDLIRRVANYEEYDEDKNRICSECKKIMSEGYMIDNGMEYYCSDKCLHKHYTEEEYMELYDDGNGESCWTSWE